MKGILGDLTSKEPSFWALGFPLVGGGEVLGYTQTKKRGGEEGGRKKKKIREEPGEVERTPLRTILELDLRAGLQGEECAGLFLNVYCYSKSIVCICYCPFICHDNIWIP